MKTLKGQRTFRSLERTDGLGKVFQIEDPEKVFQRILKNLLETEDIQMVFHGTEDLLRALNGKKFYKRVF